MTQQELVDKLEYEQQASAQIQSEAKRSERVLWKQQEKAQKLKAQLHAEETRRLRIETEMRQLVESQEAKSAGD